MFGVTLMCLGSCADMFGVSLTRLTRLGSHRLKRPVCSNTKTCMRAKLAALSVDLDRDTIGLKVMLPCLGSR